MAVDGFTVTHCNLGVNGGGGTNLTVAPTAKNIGDLVQMQMIYRSYVRCEEAVGDWDRETGKKGLKDLEDMNAHLMEVSYEASRKIEALIGEDKAEVQSPTG